jgi:hypothetical protein
MFMDTPPDAFLCIWRFFSTFPDHFKGKPQTVLQYKV